MIGDQIANFRILEKLGEGGMGVVYKALDVNLERQVAIKMLSPELSRNPEVVERFRTEARAQANLNHVNLATLFAFLVHEGNAFIVMEFVEGENFEQLIRRRGPLPAEDAIPWFKQALLGIGAAHRMGIVHRDIKPTNLMLNRQGIVKVMDFGIAKVLGVRGATRTGMQLGTPAYMSPEQVQNRQIDVRTDIYALGITLYQMLSGHVPFEEGSDFEIMSSQINTPPPPLTRMYPYAPVQYQNVVMKALEKDPNHRYQSVEEFGAALEHPESVSASFSTAPTAAVLRPTVVESAEAPQRPAGVTSPPAVAPVAVPAHTVPPVQPAPAPPVMAAGATKSGGWNVRYTIATAVVGVAAVLLAVVMFARRPSAVRTTLGPPPSASPQQPLVPTEAKVEVASGTSGLSSQLTQTSTQGLIPASAAEKEHGTNMPATGSAIIPQSTQSASNKRKQKAVTAAPSPATAAPPQAAPASNSPANASDNSAELDALEHRVDQLSSRAAAVNSSLDTLKQQQAAAGYGLRGDMAARQASMQMNLSKAQSAIEQGDAARAKRYADLTDTDLEVLEHFLGH
jgi:predicted Ser/Thr protein kinase